MSNPTETTTVSLQTRFRDVMAQVASPVSVITTMHDGQPHGTTVSAFASLSLEPPMVLVSLDRTSKLLARLTKSERFGVNVMHAEQSALALAFASRDDTDRFARAEWSTDNGLPRLAGALGWLACDVAQFVEAGDHIIALGLVTEAETRAEGAPLTYFKRTFGTHVGLQ